MLSIIDHAGPRGYQTVRNNEPTTLYNAKHLNIFYILCYVTIKYNIKIHFHVQFEFFESVKMWYLLVDINIHHLKSFFFPIQVKS